MREILFRGKQIDNGEWGVGNLSAYTLNSRQTVFIGIYKVIPETVGQYTGLCDKNGKKIFEGDIVRRNAAPMVVVWDSFDGSFITECFIDDVRCVNTLAGHSKLEVIGNIHDNRELLEVDNGT